MPCLSSACLGAASPWTPSASLALKEEYDNNVFLQEQGPLANRDSFVTTLIPSVGIKYSADPGFVVQTSYAPEIVRFHSESHENYVLHRASLGLGGKGESTEWEWQNSLIDIEGPGESLIMAGPGGVGAAGAPRVRDRRDAAIYRGGAKLTQSIGKVLVRPVISAYVHDFQAEQRTTPGYVNFVDRRDINGGVDLGTTVLPGLRGFVGYRFGEQDQARLFQYPEEYDSVYHRVLFSFEGTPRPWLKLSATLGPEFRRFGDSVPASFAVKNQDEQNLYLDCTASFIVAPSDTITVTVKQFEQPGFGGRATYEDLSYDLSWQHKFGSRATTVLTGRAYNTDFTYPAQRDDWVLSAAFTVSWSFSASLQAEVSMLYEDGESRIPNTDARDYDREVVALGLRYKFR